MIHHFENIKFQDGNVGVRIPNSIFNTLSRNIKGKSDKSNSQQISFTYAYLIAISFLYRYAYYIDIDNKTYIQNGDIKELLGYSRITKSVDKIIKKGGIIDSLGLTSSTKDYPVAYAITETRINNIPIVEYITIQDNEDLTEIERFKISDIVKNKNYEVKEPLFLTTNYDDIEYGTMYNVERTHEITIDEFLTFTKDDELNNVSFMIYGYLKTICKGHIDNKKEKALYKIVDDMSIDISTFYKHLEILKSKNYIDVGHKEWKMQKGSKMEANTYIWKGVSASKNSRLSKPSKLQ